MQSTWFIQISDPGYFFPDAVRRPWDFLFGCLLGYFPSLFPTLNHLVIILGHSANTLLVYLICRGLSVDAAFHSAAAEPQPTEKEGAGANIAALFFFFSPATLGVTLACDGLNQTYAQFWGLLALWAYLRHRRWLWPLCIVMAALSKENGLAWAVVPPLIAYGFALVDRREALRHAGTGLLIALAYFLVFFSIYYSGVLPISYADEYAQATFASHLKDFLQLMAYTWLPLDYMSAVYPPTRNLTIVIITALMALPFLLLLASKWRLLKTRRLLSLVVAFFILVSPHLLTLVSIMHNYAALSMAALIVATIITHINGKPLKTIALFTLFLAAAVFTDMHHFLAARQSGLLGKRLATQAINQAQQPLQRAFCISIDDPDEPRYSSFCVRPIDAFAWGLSVRHYSNYTWKTNISETTLTHYDPQQIEALTDSALRSGNEAVWVVGHDKENIQIISSPK